MAGRPVTVVAHPGGLPITTPHLEVLRRPPEFAQYTSIRYSDRLDDVGIAASIGSVGDSYDNAMAEALNGTFKAELVKLHGPWRSRQQLEIAIIEWIDWYNATRLHGEIGDIPPLEHEADWYRHNTPALTAGNH
jgi:putative transposase